MTLAAWLALSPLAVLVAAMAALNQPAWRAALAALALLAALTALRPEAAAPGAVWLGALPDAVVLALVVGYTLFFGLLLYQVMERGGALAVILAGVRALGRDPVEKLVWVLLVFGPLFESITGFGLAVLVVLPMLTALGYAPAAAMGLAMISQLAVPWGALAIGMLLGAEMADLPLATLGTATAVLAVAGYGAFWLTALSLARPRGAWRPARVLRTASALAVFAAGVWVANRWISPELGGVVGALALGGWLWLSGGAPGAHHATGAADAADAPDAAHDATPPGARALLRASAPYGVLVLLLAVTRYWPALQAWLTSHAVLRPPGSDFALPLLYNPGAALAVACVVALALGGRRAAGGAFGATVRQWWGAARTVFLLVLVARVMGEAGLTGALAAAGAGLPPVLGAGAISALAGVGGFLTGSIASANALFIDLQVGLAAGLGLPVLWTAAVQHVVSGGCTALSPARIVFAAAITGRPDLEGAVLRRLLPLGAALVALGALALSPWGLALLQAVHAGLPGP